MVVDLSKLPSVETVAGHSPRGTQLVTRFNVESAPTVKQITFCSMSGQIHVEFSEPVYGTQSLSSVLNLRDKKGRALDCVAGLKRPLASATGEVVSIPCAPGLPPAVWVSFDPGVSSIATKAPLLDLNGNPFDVVVDVPSLAATSDGQCATWVP